MRHLFCFIIILGTVFAAALPAMAQQPANLSGDVDLILPPVLASKDAPFYRGASVKVGDKVFPVTETATTNGQLVEFQADKNQVAINSGSNASETDKGKALLDTVTAMQASAIATASGQ